MEAVVTRTHAPPSSHAWQWRTRLIAAGVIAGGVALPTLVDSRLLMTLLVQATISGILALSDTPGTALSGGQQQMLAIGRALMANPALLVLDEPSEGLAPVIIDDLADVFRRLFHEGTSLLLIEQNYGLVRRVSDRYYVLSKGSIVDEGKMAGLSVENLHKHVAV